MNLSDDLAAPGAATPQPPQAASWRTRAAVVLAVLLPLGLTLVLHALSLRPPEPAVGSLRLVAAERVDDNALTPPAGPGRALALPLYEPPHQVRRGAPASWVLVPFTLDRAADTTWALSFSHRTAAIVYLDGRLLANSVPLVEADRPPRNLQIGERRLEVSVPADWLGAGPHLLAVRLGAPGPAGISLSPLALGPAAIIEAMDQSRWVGQSLRVLTALSALLIGTLLLFAWLVERHDRLYLGSALQLLMIAVLLSPYVFSEPPLPSPWWRMVLDAADVLAKGLAPIVIAAWAGLRSRWLHRLAFGYIAVALGVDSLAAFHVVPWTDFGHPWPWWALASRLAVLVLAVAAALIAYVHRPGGARFGTAALAALALWIWLDVSLFAIVLPGALRVVDLNVVAYAGWALWVALLLHRRLVNERRREQELRDELAAQLAARSAQLQAQFLELQASERARATAAERERLLAEMHDGVGAQLTSAKMLASGGQLSTAEFVDLLDDCLREMRLTVDALSVNDGDLGLLLAALRSRLEPPMRAAGMTLDWRVGATPRVPSLQGAGGREFARIVQEALSNIVHHAEASRVEVGTRLSADGTSIEVWVADNGRGMPATPKPGRGLRNMRVRAQRVSARIEWRAVPEPGRGTVLTIELPLTA